METIVVWRHKKKVVKELFDHLSLSAILLGAGTISWLCVHVIKKGGNYFLILQGNSAAPRSKSPKGSFSATFPLSQRLPVISRMIELLVSTWCGFFETRSSKLQRGPGTGGRRRCFPLISADADDAEDDAGGRYAEQLLDHAPRRRGCCSCRNARVRLFLSFRRLFGCRMSRNHGNHNRSQCSSLNTEGDRTAPFNMQSRAEGGWGGGCRCGRGRCISWYFGAFSFIATIKMHSCLILMQIEAV